MPVVALVVRCFFVAYSLLFVSIFVLLRGWVCWGSSFSPARGNIFPEKKASPLFFIFEECMASFLSAGRVQGVMCSGPS